MIPPAEDNKAVAEVIMHARGATVEPKHNSDMVQQAWDKTPTTVVSLNMYMLVRAETTEVKKDNIPAENINKFGMIKIRREPNTNTQDADVIHNHNNDKINKMGVAKVGFNDDMIQMT